ncbi:NUDIX hydrolase [Guptibacillus algicola]|uniref:NUDIX hydrolase n=1 Tax=Guptibacillus algicola TaxID=225844 RepID=UPI001CD7A047|nr:NUDIX domain-containing protein [Alkalihalobacillus algicola]MCA0988673.1 NUDIX domain-containing protein [Alkalihalobacillus algicola]
MRTRGSAIIIQNDKVAVIKRVRNGDVYYVFPGGGVEHGETPEEATIREAYEELGVVISVIAPFIEVAYNGRQVYFLAQILKGEFGTGEGEEFQNNGNGRGTYEPMWIDLDLLSTLNIKPQEVAEVLHRKAAGTGLN